MSQLVKTDESTGARLEICEKKIALACNKSMAATREIAKELITIHDEHLFTAKQDSFKSYIIKDTPFEYRTVLRWMDIERAMGRLEDARMSSLPTNESQAIELARLEDPGDIVEAWEAAVQFAEEDQEELTIQNLKRIVDHYIGNRNGGGGEAPAAPAKGKPAKPKADEDIEVEGKRISLSEDGESALDRIRRLCGATISEAIENGTVELSEDTIVKWAAQPDATVSNLAYYLIDKRGSWTLNKALAYDRQLITDETTMKSLLTLATARGGSIRFEHEGYEIIVRLAG